MLSYTTLHSPYRKWMDAFRKLYPSDSTFEYRVVVTSKNSNRIEESVNIGPRRIVNEPIGTAIRFT